MSADEQALQTFVGLARRQGAVAIGRGACKRAARRGTLHLLILAADAGGSVARDCGAGPEVPSVRASLDRSALGHLVGRDTVAAVGITQGDVARGLLHRLAADAISEPADRGTHNDAGAAPADSRKPRGG